MADDEFSTETTTQSLGMGGLADVDGVPGGAGAPRPAVSPTSATMPITHASATSPTVPVESATVPQRTIPFAEPGTTAPIQPVVTIPTIPTAPITPTTPTAQIAPTAAFTRPLSALPRRRTRKRLVIPLVLLLVLGLAIGGGYFAYRHFVVGPESGARGAVSAYFADIEAGDASAASALAVGPYQATPIVSGPTIARAADRPSDFAVISSSAVSGDLVARYRQAGVTGRNLTYVAVRYSVNHTAFSDTYLAEQAGSGGSGGQWLLVDPYRVLSVSGGRSSTAAVDGVAFSEQKPIEVFPGSHVVTGPPDPDFLPVGTTADLAEGTTTRQYTWTAYGPVTLPSTTPVLTSEGRTAVQAAYGVALKQCAAAAETGSGVCGIDDMYNYFTCNHVTWTITTIGAVDVDLSTQNADGSYDFTANGSVASESGDYSDFFGGDQTFSNQTTDLEASAGTITFAADGTATATLTG
ncbi:MAG TPA: hypothetical protein VFN97_26620 [Actinospica sp.]|nr:hypothetical protein [Actinospica sp.]